MAPSLPMDSNTWDVISFAVDKGHGVKGLADLGLETLPKQYIQPPEEQIIHSTVVTNDSIPVIDLSNWNDPMVAEQICNAAEKWGFFQIVNHGIPIEVSENVKEATRQFFGLPAEQKNKHSKDNSPTNNVRYGTSFTPKAEKALEWKDFLSLFYVSDDEAAAQWPSACRFDLAILQTVFCKSASVITYELAKLCTTTFYNIFHGYKRSMIFIKIYLWLILLYIHKDFEFDVPKKKKILSLILCIKINQILKFRKPLLPSN